MNFWSNATLALLKENLTEHVTGSELLLVLLILALVALMLMSTGIPPKFIILLMSPAILASFGYASLYTVGTQYVWVAVILVVIIGFIGWAIYSHFST